MEVGGVVTTEAIKLAKLQPNRHHQQTNTQFFTGQMPFWDQDKPHMSKPHTECCNSASLHIWGMGMFLEFSHALHPEGAWP